MSWDAITFVGGFKVIIPKKIEDVCDYLAEKMTTEYAILCNIDTFEGNVVTLKDEFYIPKQEVSAAFVKILSDKDEEVKNYDTIIHRHPNGLHSFSKTDEENINMNFTCSMLYTKVAGFVKGVYNLPLNADKSIKLKVDVSIAVVKEFNLDIEDEMLKEYITEYTPPSKNKKTTAEDWDTKLLEKAEDEDIKDYWKSLDDKKNDVEEIDDYTKLDSKELLEQLDLRNDEAAVAIAELDEKIEELEKLNLNIEEYTTIQQSVLDLEEKIDNLENKIESLEETISIASEKFTNA
jgi:hypothetical protein